MKKVMKISTTTILIFIGALAVTVMYFVFTSKGDVERVPSVFGYKPLTILSNSMQPEFNAGDVILINVNKTAKVGDVVTYKHADGILVTHRITQFIEREGKKLFETKGDNNEIADKDLVPIENIVGVQKVAIPKIGYLSKFVAGPFGFFLLVAIPLLGLIIIEIFQRVGIVAGDKKKEVPE